MSRLHGWSPQTPYNCLVGPGEVLENVDETLLTPGAADFDENAFLASGRSLGATDDGWEFSYEPDYAEWEFAGVPGNVRGGRRITSAEITLSGSLTEYSEDNWKLAIPGLTAEDWMAGATPTKIGNMYTHMGYLMDGNYVDNICLVAERQNTKTGIVIILYNTMNSEGFALGLEADENRSSSDVNFMASYGANSQDPETGSWIMPFKIYEPTPAVVV